MNAEASKPEPAAGGAFAPPGIALPKADASFAGLGEKFEVNAANGTASFTIPLPVSEARSNFAPLLTLGYDSGNGNGPFGLGWALPLASIERKTAKGVPRYRDSEDSDTFVLSGAEDMVPVLVGGVIHDDRATHPGQIVRRYRPRIEGPFSRVERWTDAATGAVHWRSITRDNVTSLYGTGPESRIADPDDPARVFAWLIAESRDCRGNAILFRYAAEDGAGVDTAALHEAGRGRSAGRYIKRILYGNRTPARDLADWRAIPAADLPPNDWMFEVVFDYGEGHLTALPPQPGTPAQAQLPRFAAAANAPHPWAARPDAFSTCRPGFELRTHRRCHAVLMFHHIPDVVRPGLATLPGHRGLVHAARFDYDDLPETQPSTRAEATHPGSSRFVSLLRGVTATGFAPDPDPAAPPGQLIGRSLPQMRFSYARPSLDLTARDTGLDLPGRAEDGGLRWIDLDGEGLPGLLTQAPGGLLWRRNLGPGDDGLPRLAPAVTLTGQPNLALSDPRARLVDLAGDGRLDLALLTGPGAGFHEREPDAPLGWTAFRPLQQAVNLAATGADLRLADVTGDGLPDLLLVEGDRVRLHPSLGIRGHDAPTDWPVPQDAGDGPRVLLTEPGAAVALADMTGDGLPDLVRIGAGEVAYWPCLGYGRWGRRVVMANPPRLDRAEVFDPRRVILADLDGSGPTDILYVAAGAVRIWLNQSGNRLADPLEVAGFPGAGAGSAAEVQVVDLFGRGGGCLVTAPASAPERCRFVDPIGPLKPGLMTAWDNGMGLENRLSYASSTRFRLADEAAGRPWITHLPFPVQVVEASETRDRVTGTRTRQRHAYHHGHFDGVEREFRGFAMVERWDTERFDDLAAAADGAANLDAATHLPPVLTRTWFHTGVYLGGARVSRLLAGLADASDTGEYWRPDPDDARAVRLVLPDTLLPPGLDPEDEREACRALKGRQLRREIFGLDGGPRAGVPYAVSEANFDIRPLQPRGPNRHPVFLVTPRETLDFRYERDPADPAIAHALTLAVDDWGNVLESAAISYGRQQPDPALSPQARAQQARTLMTATRNAFTDALDLAGDWRAPVERESRSFEVTGVAAAFDDRPALEVIRAALTNAAVRDGDGPAPPGPAMRLMSHVVSLRRRDDLTGPLPPAQQGALGLPWQTWTLALTPDEIAAHITPRGIPEAVLRGECGFDRPDGQQGWWIPSGRVFLSPRRADSPAEELAFARRHFLLTHRYRAPFDTDAAPVETLTRFDAHCLLLEETRSPLGNRSTAGIRAADPDQPMLAGGNDYRVLAPWRMMDPNRNLTEAAFDARGEVVATAVSSDPAVLQVQGDSLDGLAPDLPEAVIAAAIAAPSGAAASALLGRATTRMIADLHAFARGAGPTARLALAREVHASEAAAGGPVHAALVYHDASGRPVQTRTLAEPGAVPARDPASGRVIVDDGVMRLVDGAPGADRWLVSGWVVLNNKDLPVLKFEPFFSDRPGFEGDIRAGVSPVMIHDPLGRGVGVLNPDGSWTKSVVTAWSTAEWDGSDTVKLDPAADPDIGPQAARLAAFWPGPTWHALRTDPAHAARLAARYPDPGERAAQTRAARITEAHGHTPEISHLDSLGRSVAVTAIIRQQREDGSPAEQVATEALNILDIAGRPRKRIDPLGRTVEITDYAAAGWAMARTNMDSGWRANLYDIAGNPVRGWDARGQQLRLGYDGHRRPVTTHLTPAPGAAEVLIVQTVWGEELLAPEAANLRGREAEIRDQSGLQRRDAYDFKGNLTRSTRRLAREVDRLLDWAGPVPLEPEGYVAQTRYDALNRGVQMTGPHSDAAGAPVQVVQPRFDRAGLVQSVAVWLDRPAAPAGMLDPATADLTPIAGITRDARGQRQRQDRPMAGGRVARTDFRYDPRSYRLTGIYTRRGVNRASGIGDGFPADCSGAGGSLVAAPAMPPQGADCGLQNAVHVHDPVGNVTAILDRAQATVYFRNRRVDANRHFRYDSARQLVEATGREQLSQAGAPIPHDHDDWRRSRMPLPGDGNQLGRYAERYAHDTAGNLTGMTHTRSDAAVPGGNWQRSYAYAEPSAVDPAQTCNRLTSSTVSGITEAFSTAGDGYSPHGAMLRMPHLAALAWDHADRLRMTRRQATGPADEDGTRRAGDTTWYVYDYQGTRVRKLTRTAAGALRDERLYLGGLEIYRRGGANPITRDTVHVTDAGTRLVSIELRRAGSEPGVPQRLVRHQFGDMQASPVLELDDAARILSYEEYSPFGATTWRGLAGLEAPRRHRFTGQERDEETGLNHHGARYFAPWLGRWTSADPVGLAGGANLFAYCANDPVNNSDPSGLQTDSTTGGFGLSIDTGGNVSLNTASPFSPLGPRENYTFSFGISGRNYMGTAGRNTNLIPLNIQWEHNFGRSGQSGAPFMFSRQPWADANFKLPGGGLDPAYSAFLMQEALKGEHAGTVHFDMRGVEPNRSQFHTSREATVLINELQLTRPGERKVDAVIQHEDGVSRIPRDANRVLGDRLPKRLADMMPNIDNSADEPGPNQPAPTPPRPAPNAPSGGGGRPAPTQPRPNPAPAAPSGGGGGAPRGGGGGFVGAPGNLASNVGATMVRGLVPGVIEAEIGLGAGAMYAHAAGYTALGTGLEATAAAVPVIGGSLVVGTVAGHATEAGLRRVGASTEVAETGGAMAAMGAGALVGAGIGLAGGGIGAGPGAIIGGAVGLGGYLISRYW